MVDDVDSFVTIARLLKERGAYKIYVMATHGLLSAEAPRLIEDSPIDEVRTQTSSVMNSGNVRGGGGWAGGENDCQIYRWKRHISKSFPPILLG